MADEWKICLCCRNSASSRGPRLLEEILRWGTTQLFDSSASAGRDALHAQEVLKRESDHRAEAMDMDGAATDLPGVHLVYHSISLASARSCTCAEAMPHTRSSQVTPMLR